MHLLWPAYAHTHARTDVQPAVLVHFHSKPSCTLHMHRPNCCLPALLISPTTTAQHTCITPYHTIPLPFLLTKTQQPAMPSLHTHIAHTSVSALAGRNEVNTNDIVDVVDGPLKGKNGTVRYIMRGILFIQSREVHENGGFVCIRAQHCKVGGRCVGWGVGEGGAGGLVGRRGREHAGVGRGGRSCGEATVRRGVVGSGARG